MGTMVEISGLRKEFGSIVAVDGVSFTVGQGEVLGFLGPNGAGKSTTMKMITGFLTPTGGTAKICGYDILEQPLEAKKTNRLFARRRASLPRYDTPRFSYLRRSHARIPRRRTADPSF